LLKILELFFKPKDDSVFEKAFKGMEFFKIGTVR
jgi:hypothetical protein